MSEDPIGFDAGDRNLRRYGGNFSTGVVDPSGLEETESPFNEQQFLNLLEAFDPRVHAWWTSLERRGFPQAKIDRVNAKGQGWWHGFQWLGGALTRNTKAYITPDHGVVLRVDKSYSSAQVAMLVATHARNGNFLQDVHPGARDENAGFSFYTGLYDVRKTLPEDVRQSTIALAKLGIKDAQLLLEAAYGFNDGADIAFTLADILDEGFKAEHAMAMVPFVSVGAARGLDTVVDIGGGVAVRWSDELAEALQRIPESELQGVLKRAGDAKNSDQAYNVIIEAGRNAPRRIPIPGSGWTSKRVDELTAMIPSAQQGRITMGVGLARDPKTGKMIRLVSTSEPVGYLRPGVTLKRGERLIPGTGHAEVDIVNYAKSQGLELLEIGATRPICDDCAKILGDALPVTPLKNP